MDPSREDQQHQEMGCESETLESMLVCTNGEQEKKAIKPHEEALKCPRCDSTNTKFCYYNNYSLTQPRYFCKSCRRYWTKGGTLRNVPVGGGCRKNKRSTSSSSTKRSQDLAISSPNPNPFSYDSDISLAIARLQKQNFVQLGFDNILGNPNFLQSEVLPGSLSLNSSAIAPGLFDALRGGFLDNPNATTYQNMYYGNMGQLENGGLSLGINDVDEMGYDQEMGCRISTTTVTTVKQEMCNPREGESRELVGFPWQFGGEGNTADFEPAKQNWNGLGSSSWHGLLNSPLM